MTLQTTYRSSYHRCRWCRLAVIPVAEAYCRGCTAIRDLQLQYRDAVRDESLAALLAEPESSSESEARS